ncbi:MAG: class I SAM-dependent methyltransferase [Azospirillum sp.]|nr:class I SAM-dependent methyltransferase [Azospirillum sp.]
MRTTPLIDAAVELNLVPTEYFVLWEELGGWQLDALKAAGLQRHHRLLDVGCGAMRLGLKAVAYLETGNYYGVDAFVPYLKLARRLAEREVPDRRFELLLSESFEFSRFGVTFDFGMAQSVFTHLSAEQCESCVAELRKAMAPGGVFVFTFLIGAPVTQGFLYGAQQPMRRLAVEDPDYFAKLGARFGARFEPLAFPHPTGQHVALYRF